MAKGRVLLYQALYGGVSGEDAMFFRWRDLLTQFGFQVDAINPPVPRSSTNFEKTVSGLKSIWNQTELDKLGKTLASTHYDLAVFGNVEYISAGAMRVARQAGIKTVCILHNYKPVCPQGSLFREGQECSLCPEKDPLSAIWTRCVRGKFLSSVLATARTELHKIRHSYADATVVLCPSQFHASRMIDYGFDAQKTRSFPNWLPPYEGTIDHRKASRKGEILFAGRLEFDKGVLDLVNAWRKSSISAYMQLNIVGDGSLREELSTIASPSIRILGAMPAQRVRELMASCLAVVVPSRVAETFGLTAAESLSTGTPILTSSAGALPEINSAEVGSCLHEFNADALDRAWSQIDVDWESMSRAALQRYNERYSEQIAMANLEKLVQFLKI